MGLVAIAIDIDRRFPLVLAANRDEFFHRATARLGWWQPHPGGPTILGGRDVDGGGTWLGLTAEGRLAFVTNSRGHAAPDPRAPSRGCIVLDWLTGTDSSDRFWMRTALSGYNGFHLVAVDFRQGACFSASNLDAHPKRLDRGVHAACSETGSLEWPKVAKLRHRMKAAIDAAESVDALSIRLFEALADREEALPDDLLNCALSLEKERQLSPAFVRMPDINYGTRSSTLVITERVNKQYVTHVLERTFAPSGTALLRRATLTNWPPRYADTAQWSPGDTGEVEETELPSAPRRTRVRSLLKPSKLK